VDTTKIKVSIGRTYNVGNYESLRLDVGIEEETEGVFQNTQTEKFVAATQALFDMCEEALKKEKAKVMAMIEDKYR
jgi:hypothetical protein